jgi:hypothetical protein
MQRVDSASGHRRETEQRKDRDGGRDGERDGGVNSGARAEGGGQR